LQPVFLFCKNKQRHNMNQKGESRMKQLHRVTSTCLKCILIQIAVLCVMCILSGIMIVNNVISVKYETFVAYIICGIACILSFKPLKSNIKYSKAILCIIHVILITLIYTFVQSTMERAVKFPDTWIVVIIIIGTILSTITSNRKRRVNY